MTILSEDGLEPLRLFQVYGYSRAKDDPERMDLNEKLLGKVFREAEACGSLPIIIMKDFNIDPAYSKVVTEEVVNGSWVDAATIQPSFDGSEPPWTFSQKGTTSRIDICLLNASAMQLFSNFEQWDHEEYTIPNHKLQCITLTLGEAKQFAKKPFKPFAIPDSVKLSKDDVRNLTSTIIEKYVDSLRQQL